MIENKKKCGVENESKLELVVNLPILVKLKLKRSIFKTKKLSGC